MNVFHRSLFLLKVFNFLNSRCLAAHLLKRNPRECRWTVLYRRKHKKGAEEETVKKRTRKTVKYQRAIAGTSLTEILAKRDQKVRSNFDKVPFHVCHRVLIVVAVGSFSLNRILTEGKDCSFSCDVDEVNNGHYFFPWKREFIISGGR